MTDKQRDDAEDAKRWRAVCERIGAFYVGDKVFKCVKIEKGGSV